MRITVTDLLVKICAQGLVRHPDVNVQFTDEALLRFPNANVGLAVATDQGLVVPVIRTAERLTLAELAAARADVVGRARERKLGRADMDGGTFTISNLGMFGVEQFIAVLNPPQAAILAVGAAEDRPVALDGEVVVRPMMTVTLTVDHRAVDGAARCRVPADGEGAARGSRARALDGSRWLVPESSHARMVACTRRSAQTIPVRT